MGVNGFILAHERANGNGVPVFYLPYTRIYRFSGWPMILLATFLTLKMEAICSSETSVETRRTTRRHIPKDDTYYHHRCENLKSYMMIKLFVRKEQVTAEEVGLLGVKFGILPNGALSASAAGRELETPLLGK
jgi:hypothetical protein